VSVHHRSGPAREDVIVTRLHQLAPSLDGEPDAAFQATTRARLVAMAAVRSPEPAPSRLQRLLSARAADVAPVRWRARLTASLAGAALAVTALASLVAVADNARPGDVLYDLKRGTEQTQLALAGDSRGQTLLDFAGTRLDEVEALVGDGGTALPATPAGPGDTTVSAAGADPALVVETLRTMDEQTEEGTAWLTDRAVETGDTGPLDHLARWSDAQAAELAALRPLVPQGAGEAVGQSLTLLSEIGTRTDGLQSVLGCTGGPAVAGSDDLGPVPSTCSVPDAAPPSAGGGSTGTATGTGTSTSTSGTAAAPGGTTPGLATVPPTAGSGTGGRPGGVPSGGVSTPTTPGGGILPSLPVPLPRPGTGSSTTPTTMSPPAVQLPPVGPMTVCLPPLATVGNC
jgi:hypothetical protein